MVDFEVTLATGAPEEEAVREALLRLRASYDTSPYEWTRSIRIEKGAIPRSHPVLTLSERYGTTQEELLATYLHEQLHYWSMQCPGALDGRDEAVYASLAEDYPLPVGHPDGCPDAMSNLIHLHVCWLELEVTEHFLGTGRAGRLMGARPHYRAIYRAVLENRSELRERFEPAGMGVPGSPHSQIQ